MTVFAPPRERARSYPSPTISLYLSSNSIIYRHIVTNRYKGAVTVAERPSLSVTSRHGEAINSVQAIDSKKCVLHKQKGAEQACRERGQPRCSGNSEPLMHLSPRGHGMGAYAGLCRVFMVDEEILHQDSLERPSERNAVRAGSVSSTTYDDNEEDE